MDKKREQYKSGTSAVRIWLRGDDLVVRFPHYNDAWVGKVKSLPGRKWDSYSREWLVPARSVEEALAMFPAAQVAPEVLKLAQRSKELATLSGRTTSEFVVAGLQGELLSFQAAGVEFLEATGGRAIIADQMGLGKTIQTLAYLQLHPELRPAVIVVPASIKINWMREINKWLSSSKRIVILNGTKVHALASSDIYIINYDILTNWVNTLLNIYPKLVVLDEAHYIKNRKAARTKAVKALVKKVDHVILLTGTPVLNRPAELFPLLNIVDPCKWDDFFAFADRYCDAHYTSHGLDTRGASNLKELRRRVRPYIRRCTKAEVVSQLPPKRRVTIPMPLSAPAKKEYMCVFRETQAMIEAARAEGESIRAEHLTQIEKLKQAAVRSKLSQVTAWIADFIESDQKLIVFAIHHFVIDALIEEFGSQAVRVTGSDSQQVRQQAVDKFQNDDSVRLFVGNIQAAGVGITLTAASDVAFLEFGWTPGEHDQAEDRCHRIGQRGSVTCWYLAADGTIDEKIIHLLERKRIIVDKATDGKPGELRFSIFNELVEIILPQEEQENEG